MSHQRSNLLLPVSAALTLMPLMSVLASIYAAHDALLVTYLIVGLTAFLVMLRMPTESEDKLFLVAVSCVCLSLFLATSLASTNIIGDDMNLEFYLFEQVLMNGGWHTAISTGITSRYNTALAITILPAIINIESSVDGVLIFKLLFPILYSMVPIVLYKIYRQFLAPRGAFMSVFVFMVNPTFYTEMLQLGRQMIAEVFLVLLLLVAISKRKESRTHAGMLLTLILSLGVVTAHYSIAYVFLLLMMASLFMARVSSRVERLWDSGILLVYLVLMVGWFLLVTSGTALFDLATALSLTLTGITNDLLNPASRPTIVQNALFLNAPEPGLLHVLSRASQYIAVASIAAGFLIFLRRKRKTVAERQMLPMMTISFGIVFAAAALPFFGSILNFSRFFHLALIFISPCFFIGLQWVTSALREFSPPRLRVRMPGARVSLPAALVFMYFIFTSGWVWTVTRDPYPTSIVLDGQRMQNSSDLTFVQGYYGWYIVPQDAASAYWLRTFGSPRQAVCANLYSTDHALTSYGGRNPNDANLAYAFEYGTCAFSRNEYVYFSEFNTHYGMYGTVSLIPISNIQLRIATKNRVYSGGATIYQ